MTPAQKQVYDQCMKQPPSSRFNGIGSAYFQGLEHPDQPAGAKGGDRGSLAYAAWKAGRDTAAKPKL